MGLAALGNAVAASGQLGLEFGDKLVLFRDDGVGHIDRTLDCCSLFLNIRVVFIVANFEAGEQSPLLRFPVHAITFAGMAAVRFGAGELSFKLGVLTLEFANVF